MQSTSSSGKSVCYFSNMYALIWLQLLASVMAERCGNGTTSESASACVLASASSWTFSGPQEKLLCKMSSVPMLFTARENWSKKSAKQRRLPSPHWGKKTATAVSYRGIWESSAAKPVPWGSPSVVTELAPNPPFLSMTVEKLVVRQVSRDPVLPGTQRQAVTGRPVWAGSSQQQVPAGTGCSSGHAGPVFEVVIHRRFLGRCCGWGACSPRSRASNVTSSCFACAMWVSPKKRTGIWGLSALCSII